MLKIQIKHVAFSSIVLTADYIVTDECYAKLLDWSVTQTGVYITSLGPVLPIDNAAAIIARITNDQG